MTQAIERKTSKAVDRVQIVYSAAGVGEPALVFIHGGLANRGFWDGELKAFAARYRVIALDLPGHGESGTNRQHWGIPQFGADVRAVIEAEHIKKAILFGNSLGGPVMKHTGHYPMLERPEEFHRLVAETVASLLNRTQPARF